MLDYDSRWTEAATMIRETLGQEGIDALAAKLRADYDLVTNEKDACPRCAEDRVDWLYWRESDEGEYVECASCGAWYDPMEAD